PPITAKAMSGFANTKCAAASGLTALRISGAAQILMTPSTPMTRNQPTMTGPNRRPMLAVPRRCIMNSPIRIAKCPLSGSAPGADRSHWRTSACHVRQHALFHRTYQGRQAAPFGGDRQGLPDVPTLGDFVPGFETSAWAGIGAPKNTPAEIIDT